MPNTRHIVTTLERTLDTLAHVKSSLLTQERGNKDKSKKTWERLMKSSKKVKWDSVSAAEEIRKQREKS